jgi:hypothetical protein
LLSDGYVVIPMNDKGSWAYRVFHAVPGQQAPSFTLAPGGHSLISSPSWEKVEKSRAGPAPPRAVFLQPISPVRGPFDLKIRESTA